VALRLLAGHPALDFVNTIDPRVGAHRVEHLGAYQDLVRWAARAGVLTAAEAKQAARVALRDRAAAAHALDRAIELREALYAVFGAVAARRRVPADEMRRLHTAYRDAMAHASLTQAGHRFHWQLSGGLDVVRWHMARAAIALLESKTLRRVKRCPGAGECGWLFFDSSKNASRRWCSMEGCGNRAKLRRFLRRRRGRSGDQSPGVRLKKEAVA
jgi:predicted RNA-binding Zn ribbon-like protein